MTSMVEKVARALDAEAWQDLSEADNYPANRRRMEVRRSNSELMACAAIQTMREMTPGMVKAAEAKDMYCEYAPADVHWEAAIDAALKEE